MYNQTINRCQPGYGASCSLCCGSHNYKVSVEKIENIFFERGQKCDATSPKDPESSDHEKLFPDAIQCSHVGIKPYGQGNIGCLIYDGHNLKSKTASFYNWTCKNFNCSAWDDLTDEQVIFAARLMEDWYYCSLFINDIEAVHDLHATYSYPEDVPDDELEIIKEELLDKFVEEDGK